MNSVPTLLRNARRRARLTQRELAERAGTSQSAVARLEAGQASPTVATLERLLGAAGFEWRAALVPLPVATDAVIARYKQDVDRSLLRANLQRSVDERLRLLVESQAAGEALAAAVCAVRPRSASTRRSGRPHR